MSGLLVVLLGPITCFAITQNFESCSQEQQGVAVQDFEQRSNFRAVQFRIEEMQGGMAVWHLHTCEG